MYNAPKFERFDLNTYLTYKGYTIFVSLVDLGDYKFYRNARYELMAFAVYNHGAEDEAMGGDFYDDRFGTQVDAAREFFRLTDNADLWLKPYEEDIAESLEYAKRRR